MDVLYQSDTQVYDHYRHYRILDAGQRTTKVTKAGVTFTQPLSGLGYGYVYEKTLSLLPGKPQLLIAHRLRNTGQKAINTSVYDHNFLRLIAGNGGMTVTFPFPPAAANPPPSDLMLIKATPSPIAGPWRTRNAFLSWLSDLEKQSPITPLPFHAAAPVFASKAIIL